MSRPSLSNSLLGFLVPAGMLGQAADHDLGHSQRLSRCRALPKMAGSKSLREPTLGGLPSASRAGKPRDAEPGRNQAWICALPMLALADRSADRVDLALRDLEQAEQSMQADRHECVCFAAHQAVEKALKGLNLALAQQAWVMSASLRAGFSRQPSSSWKSHRDGSRWLRAPAGAQSVDQSSPAGRPGPRPGRGDRHR